MFILLDCARWWLSNTVVVLQELTRRMFNLQDSSSSFKSSSTLIGGNRLIIARLAQNFPNTLEADLGDN